MRLQPQTAIRNHPTGPALRPVPKIEASEGWKVPPTSKNLPSRWAYLGQAWAGISEICSQYISGDHISYKVSGIDETRSES